MYEELNSDQFFENEARWQAGAPLRKRQEQLEKRQATLLGCWLGCVMGGFVVVSIYLFGPQKSALKDPPPSPTTTPNSYELNH